MRSSTIGFLKILEIGRQSAVNLNVKLVSYNLNTHITTLAIDNKFIVARSSISKVSM